MILALTIVHVIISVALVLVVLLQHGKQQGLSGAIAGGAETFFGKNKGRTIDAMLKKFTAVIAILFIISSLALAAVSINEYNKNNPVEEEPMVTTEDGAAIDTSTLSVDEEGNLVDASGNIVATAEDLAAQEGEVVTEPVEGEVVAEPAEGEAVSEPLVEAEDAPAENAE